MKNISSKHIILALITGGLFCYGVYHFSHPKIPNINKNSEISNNVNNNKTNSVKDNIDNIDTKPIKKIPINNPDLIEMEISLDKDYVTRDIVSSSSQKATRINVSNSIQGKIAMDYIEPISLPVKISTQKEIKENDIKLVSKEPISTFSTDADDGSYKIFNSQLKYNNLVETDLVRTEEFINAFDYNYEVPKSIKNPFSTNIKITDSPWSENKLMLIGIKGFEYNIDTLPPVNLTFLVDVSGSMSSHLRTVQTGLKMLVNKLRPEDRISLVTYAGGTRIALENTEVKNKNKILSAIDSLTSGGSTNGSAGIHLAYKENKNQHIEDGINRILLVSDGDFNVGITGDDLKDLIKEKRKSGTTFSTIGIGGSNYNDHMMEQMSNVGNGNYTFIGDIKDAREVFADSFIGTLKNIAKDVKYQIEFNPDLVKEYRLIGYENRMLKTEDFNNDKIDAGELPSGATATAIYEITLAGQEGLYPESRYAKKESKNVEDFSNELAFLKIRFKQPNASKSELLKFPIKKNIIGKNISNDDKFAISVAGFAQVYRNSDFVSESYSYEDIINNLNSLKLTSFKKLEFVENVKTTKELKK